MAKVGVESHLTDIMQALRDAGHKVVTLEGDGATNCDCYVISGHDQNVMGMSTATTDASVINCHGMTANEVVQAVNSRIQ